MVAIGMGREASRVELTVRGVILGVLITLLFTAANIYLGLKVGLTVATSIPAAVISMALLRAFKDATVWENNIVQTVASAAGAMASVIFVLPGLLIVGAWTHFPFWMTFGLCATGGVLGVMFTIPLRRALVTQSDLPYPEGVAAAEVLAVGSGARADTPAAVAEGKAGLHAILLGSVVSAIFAALTKTGLLAEEADGYWRLPGGGATGMGFSMSLALLGVGHLVGLAVGVSMLVGLTLTWGVAVPLLTHLSPEPGAAADVAKAMWTHKVRFLGAGTIGVAAIWTLIRLAAPVWRGLASAMAAQRGRGGERAGLPRAEQDIPIAIVAMVSGLMLVPMALLIVQFLQGGPLAPLSLPLTAAALVYVVVAGFAVAAVCGYMAGLVGSSNSPVSGVAILAVLGASLLVAAIGAGAVIEGDAKPLVAFALVITSILLAAAVSANDNLQDLKTGQLVDATPWRQQAALVVGVVAGSAVIPPVLELLNRSNGFAGAPNLAAISNQPLPAPQATLISTIAKGVIAHNLDWGMIGIGAAIGIVVIAIDEALRRTKRASLPPLGVGMAIYLPASLTVPVIVGALAGWVFNREMDGRPDGEVAKRMAVLVVSGLIVGESLFNVALAGLIVGTNSAEPLALVKEGFAPAVPAALIVCATVGVALYAWSGRRAART
jgi:putative OPT family oligopeptide transporter